MKKHTFISIKTKTYVSVCLIAALAAASIIVFISPFMSEILGKEELKSIYRETILSAEAMQGFTDTIKSDVLSLAYSPQTRAVVKNVDTSTASATLRQYTVDEQDLQKLFVAYEESKKIYTQLRYINEKGQEIVRVDYDNFQTKVVPKDGLQYKGNRYYFSEAMKSRSGEAYVSRIDLNREGKDAQITTPFMPVLRIAYTVYGPVEKKGIIIANILGQKLLHYVPEVLLSDRGETLIVDHEGYYIHNINTKKEWGGPSDLNTGHSLVKDNPEIAQVALGGTKGSLITTTHYVAYAPIFLNQKDTFIVIIKLVPKSIVFAPMMTLIKIISGITFLALLLFWIVTYFGISRIIEPFSRIIGVAEHIGQGDFSEKLDEKYDDERGIIAKSINDMAQKMQKIYRELDMKIKERTVELDAKVSELDKKNLELQKYSQAMLNIADDIKQEKEQIAQEKKKYETLLTSIGEGVVAHDQLGKVIFVNKAAQKMLLYSENDLIGQSFVEVVAAEDEKGNKISPSERPLIISKQNLQYVEAELVYVRKDGTKFFASIVDAPIILNDQYLGHIQVINDITNQKQLDKMKDEFLSVASHELRTPLTAIDGLVSMILDGEYGEVSENLKQPLGDVNLASERLINLVNDLLNISRIQAGRLKFKLTNFNLKDATNEITNLLSVVAREKGLTLDTSGVQDVQVQADMDKVKEVLNNLVGNSLKFTDKGFIKVFTRVENEFAILFVQDSGIGIQEGDKEKLFGKFNQLDSGSGRPQGTGLGLFISKEICSKMGGELYLANSVLGQGSTFAFSIPLSNTKVAQDTLEKITKEAQLHQDQKSDIIQKT